MDPQQQRQQQGAQGDQSGQSAVGRLDQDQLRALAANGATLLLLGVPAGTQLGIDFHTYTAGPRFREDLMHRAA
jgi:hypothetical protein